MQAFMSNATPYFRRVLLATDFSSASEAAFRAALQVCKAFRASLLILHVLESISANPSKVGGELLEMGVLYQRAGTAVNGLTQVAQQAGLVCAAETGSGIPSLTILETIRSKNIDLAVLGTNDSHGLERLIFGSTAEAVLRNACCPVMTVGPHVLAAVNTSEAKCPVVFSTGFHLTTIHAIRYAVSFCKVTESPLHCLHILPPSFERSSHNQLIPQILTEALQQLAIETASVINSPVCAIEYDNEIPRAVVGYAKYQKAKLVVLGVRRALMATSHFPGHIAYRIIAEAPCPVLTVAYGP